MWGAIFYHGVLGIEGAVGARTFGTITNILKSGPLLAVGDALQDV